MIFLEALAGDVMWSSQFGGDSSPQKGVNFNNCIEERFVFDIRGDYAAFATRCAEGFVAKREDITKIMPHIRRTLPPQLLGFGEEGSAHKFAKFVKALALETPPDKLEARRATASG